MTRPVRSLRSRLLRMIVLPLLGVAVLVAGFRYFEAKQTAQGIYDNSLLSIAHVIARDVVLTDGDLLAEQLLETLTDALGDPIFYHVAGDSASALVVGYTNPPRPPGRLAPEAGTPVFYDSVYRGDPVRVVALREFISTTPFDGWVNVTVWQLTSERERLRDRLTGRAAAVMALIIAVAGAIIWFGINIGLKPLFDLQQAIEVRSADDLSPIRRAVPREVSSLVTAMNALFRQLRDAFAERDGFIANAAHQLRNPIAGIQSQAEAAAGALETEDLRARVADVSEAARRASRLTGQLLSMERVSRRTIADSFEAIDVAGIIRDAAGRIAPRALRKGVEISLVGAETEAASRGNPTLLGEVFDNLLDNALRYGCRDGGAIAITLEPGRESLRVLVEDTGPGIPDEFRPRLFERFTRGVEDGSDGCGLGLAIAKSIVEGHGGVLTIESGPDGTRAAVVLPTIG